MADAVHFLGQWQDSPNEDLTAFGTGFFAAFVASTVDPPRFPITVAFDKIIKWHWRVENWALATDFAIIGGSGTSIPSGVCTPGGGNPTRELDMATTNTDQSFANDSAFINPFGADVLPGVFQPLIAFDTPDYKPAIRMQGSLTNGTSTLQWSSRSDSGFATGTMTAHLDSESITIYYDFTGPDSFTATQLDYTPVKFWPYAAANGSPIYDTTTGAQLQDPRN